MGNLIVQSKKPYLKGNDDSESDFKFSNLFNVWTLWVGAHGPIGPWAHEPGPWAHVRFIGRMGPRGPMGPIGGDLGEVCGGGKGVRWDGAGGAGAPDPGAYIARGPFAPWAHEDPAGYGLLGPKGAHADRPMVPARAPLAHGPIGARGRMGALPLPAGPPD